ncbi:unnamed protein product [Rotaria magnacalcarata]|uniref:Uncharacterized protein n=1 Tax=Rotaria magnacalcarata TaxID=392030 RepID=A0A8S2NEF0_9BILA|nr:unnamed protein product [Rotaria magnacalcarata]CAF5169243.1 unnamed protein product [Rotaria magnacalcarata]
MSQRYMLTSNISQTNINTGKNEIDITEGDGSHPIKVIAFKVDTPLSAATSTNICNPLNNAIELHIGEREMIGQVTENCFQ